MDKSELEGVAALAEPARRALYEYVAGQADAVGREQAAEALGVTRQVAAFHLDRLVALGLLETESRRLTGRSGPGAGRPAKLYRRSRRDFAVSVPPRRYQLAAELLAEAVQRSVDTGTAVGAALAEVARTHGARLGRSVATRLRPRAGRRAVTEAVRAELADQGYVPRVVGDEVVLGSCPFDALADSHRDLVCGMNLELLDAMTQELPDGCVSARLEPAADACCVRLRVRR